MRAGSLDRTVTIQRKAVTQSESGEPVETWTTLARRAASMRPVRGDERFAAPQIGAQEQIEFRVRYSTDMAALSPQDRVIYPALAVENPETPAERQIHDIVAVHEIGRREGLQIITTRRPDVTS